MATKKFCDFCDTEMKADHQFYSIAGNVTSERNYYHDHDKMTLPGNVYVPIQIVGNEVCVRCYKAVLTVIEKLKSGPVLTENTWTGNGK